MNFLLTIVRKLAGNPDKPILYEIHEGELRAVTCRELLAEICLVRRALVRAGLRPGDRCALLAPNSARWVAFDLAIMAEGLIVVPLYSRQAPEELVQMMKDCTPALLCCADESLRDAVTSRWQGSPRVLTFSELLATPSSPTRCEVAPGAPSTQLAVEMDVQRPVTIIYTSGTSREPKGVVLSVGNLNFMLERTTSRLEELMSSLQFQGDHRVFHYLPFCFAGSWVTLLTCLVRNNSLMISMDLNRLADEIRQAAPHYFLNVPAVLERVRNAVHAQMEKRGRLARTLFFRGQGAWGRRRNNMAKRLDRMWLKGVQLLVFPKIRSRLGPNLRALICGSAPLSEETQLFFQMVGIPVLQVYGLTETTAICTMDQVDDFSPGRVGPAIPGIEMRLGANDEILVRGPHVFPGYWNRPQATEEMLREGWLHTGDQGEVDPTGNWKIMGRLKNLIITSGGHNIRPEPVEQLIQSALPAAEHVVLVGNGRKFVSALITGHIPEGLADSAIQKVNQQLSHYKQIRRFYICQELFTIENGLLTVNRKLRRALIAERFKEQIESLYRDP